MFTAEEAGREEFFQNVQTFALKRWRVSGSPRWSELSGRRFNNG